MLSFNDLLDISALPQDPNAPEFYPAAMRVAETLGIAARDNKGLRAAMHIAVQHLMVGISLGTDRPRATLHMLIAEMTEQAEEVLVRTGRARLDT